MSVTDIIPTGADFRAAGDAIIEALRQGIINAGDVLEDAQARVIVENMTPEQRARLEAEYIRQRFAGVPSIPPQAAIAVALLALWWLARR